MIYKFWRSKALVDVSMDPDEQVVVITNSEKGTVPKQLWQERSGRLLSFFQGFKKAKIRIPAELADEVSERWRKAQPSTETSTDLNLSVNKTEWRVSLEGFKKYVRRNGSMEENIRSVEQDTELMKSIGKVTEDVIARVRLRLFETSSTCQNVSISI